YNRWGEVLGPDHAETMIEMFNHVATKEDVGRLEDRFDQMELRFDQIDRRFEKIDARFEKIDDRFAKMDDRFVEIHQRLDNSSEQVVGFYKNMVVTVAATMTALTGIFAALLTV